jgi:hypothetical protein
MNTYLNLSRLAPNVLPEMLDARFWLNRAPDPDALLLAPDQIAAFNARVYETLNLPPVLSLPDTLPRAAAEAPMRAFVPGRILYRPDGQPVEPDIFERTLEKLVADLPDALAVNFGLITENTHVRAFPMSFVFTAQPFEYALDRIQETTADVGCPVAILAEVFDHQWAFCLTPLYWGWIRRAHIAQGTREGVERYTLIEPGIVTTAAWGGLVNRVTGLASVSQMGTRLPWHGESPEIYETSLPMPDESDMPLFVRSYAYRADFAVGSLPCTRRSLFTQAFKLLGEPYAWGGSRFGLFGRDCSRLVQDVYATTGVRLPRNAGEQERVCQPQVVFTPEMSDQARKTRLVETVSPGALLNLPGHVMLYLGHVNGEPYVIHDTSSSGFSEVIVSDLSLGADSPSGSLLQRLTQAGMVG